MKYDAAPLQLRHTLTISPQARWAITWLFLVSAVTGNHATALEPASNERELDGGMRPFLENVPACGTGSDPEKTLARRAEFKLSTVA